MEKGERKKKREIARIQKEIEKEAKKAKAEKAKKINNQIKELMLVKKRIKK